MGNGNLEETPKVEWTRVENVGWKYTAPRPDNSPPFTLVVFVHGFRGHSRKTWKEMPAKCLEEYHKRKHETANADDASSRRR